MSKSHESAVRKAVMMCSLSKLKQAIADGEIVDALDREGRTPLFYASGEGLLEIATELIQRGADCNKNDKHLETPLHFAAREYRVEVAKLLISQGARVDAQDAYGNTSLSHAVFYSRGRGDVINLLLSSGADRSLKNKHGVSPEQLATTIANYDVSQFFKG